MNIAEVISRLCELERTLTVEIDGLGDFKIENAYEGPVPNNEAPGIPCFTHKWAPDGELAINGYPNGLVLDRWTIHVQALIAEYPTDRDSWAQVASYFFTAWREMLMRNMKLGESGVALDRIRVDLEQPTVIGEQGEVQHIGFDCFLDLTINETFLVGTGE